MKTFTSSWEVASAAASRVRVDASVLDQLLRGCAEVRWEIQSLQDQDVTVETLEPQATTTCPDLAALRQALCEEAEIVVLPVGTSSSTVGTALWSVGGSRADRRRLAQLMGWHLYEPQVLIQATAGDLTGRKALTLAAKIGAISPQRDVALSNGSARLVGLQQIEATG